MADQWAGVITLAAMVLQWIGSFAASKTWGATARKFIPVANFVVATASQLIAAFATGLGPAPAPVPGAAPAVIMAGFFATVGNTFIDVLINSVIQTFLVVGGHSAIKNTQQGIAMAKGGK